MSIEGLIASGILAVLVVLWIGLPWLTGKSRKNQTHTESLMERQRERLTIYYSRVLRNIHDLDEDYATGKLNPDDYQQERELWVARGIAVLKAQDELDSAALIADSSADDASIDAAIDGRIEAAVMAARQQN